MARQLFRKVSLERLSSPEQLDLLMQVTTPTGWLALLALGAILTVAIIWGILGSIPEKVTGQGILIRSGGVFQIVALRSGQITELSFDVGDIIQEGQIVARIALPELLDKIKQARNKLKELQIDHDNYAEFGTQDIRIQTEYIAHQRLNLGQTNRNLERRLKALKERKGNQTKLLKKGLITQATILNTQQEIDNAQGEIEKNRNEFNQLSAKELEVKNQRRQELVTKKQNIDATERDLDTLRTLLDLETRVLSPYSGRILEIERDPGQLINAGDSILSLEGLNKLQDLEGVLYIPFAQGKKLHPGMQAQISPSTVKEEEFGFMLGLVTFVSEYPVTSQGMLRILDNESLVQSLSLQSPPLEVRVTLLPDPNTKSGYKWSSPQGPPVSIQSGTLCFSTITVREQAPISMVIPTLKKYLLGVGGEEFTGKNHGG